MDKKEPNLEDGLQSQSLGEIESCSSSILDSEEEEDGINVTIKAVVPGVLGDGLCDQANVKLAGSERRKVKKLVEKGMEVDEARAKVVSSTPKRSRNAVLNSPNEGDTNPDPKKVCASKAAAFAKGTDLPGPTVSRQQDDDVKLEESVGQKEDNPSGSASSAAQDESGKKENALPGPFATGSGGAAIEKKKNKKKKKKDVEAKEGDTKKSGGADQGNSKMTEVTNQGDTKQPGQTGRSGGRKNSDVPEGSESKKPRKEILPAPTYQQIASRVTLGIIHAGYPDVELTSEQQEAVKEALLSKVLEQLREQFKPKFVYCKAKIGHVMLLCQDKDTANWVKKATSTVVPWENAVLSALEEAEIPRKDVLLAFFYRSKSDNDDTIRGYLESQNDNLDTLAWRIHRRSGKNEHVDWMFTVDAASMKLLEERQFVVNYKSGQTMFRKKRSASEIHPADDESDNEMDVDWVDERLSSEALSNQLKSAQPT